MSNWIYIFVILAEIALVSYVAHFIILNLKYIFKYLVSKGNWFNLNNYVRVSILYDHVRTCKGRI